jgi:hypothetical protein
MSTSDELYRLRERLNELENLRECGEVCLNLRHVVRWNETQLREIYEDMDLVNAEFTEIVMRIVRLALDNPQQQKGKKEIPSPLVDAHLS